MVHFIAWRYLADKPAYVEHIGNGRHRGDRYSYTSNIKGAKSMTEKQAREFCKYMRDCGTIGFWSGQHDIEA